MLTTRTEFRGPPGGGGAGLQQRGGIARAKSGGVGAGVNLDPVGARIVHRRDRGGIGIDKQDHAAAERLQLIECGVDEAALHGVELPALLRGEGVGASGTNVHCSGRISATRSRKRRSG